MSIGVLLVTHPGIGKALLNNASELIGACPLQVRCMDIPLQCDTAQLQQTVLENARKLDDGSGVLILTDAFGATPSNIACQLTREMLANVVSGLNLPMLIRVFNYASDDLQALTHKAAEGGIRGIQVSHTGEAAE
ncbi:MAG TPA: PTS fructose transporter subunit IIA [Thiolapillus brandeum]|uniref:PTS fructose transporter subunit IIA n=1 Tax=Thiolapillus brandeum TaxID=1076588 RepID=A0A831RWX5_9GAMM|nr:PTS fructose transporter subunit IIA [Thiolapillus brandeum]